ncbi:MAG TPA: O-methyltransferase [Thermoplasmata archaeon]|nr:O-methyltransferase [Thermoplasmata archaeon]
MGTPGPDGLWSRVDEYFESVCLPPDPTLQETLRRSEESELPAWAVTPLQGRFLYLLARSIGARRMLEIGTLGGYSAIWLARALPPDGRLVTLEVNPKHAKIARGNLEAAGVSDRVEIRLGRAEDSLRVLSTETGPPFDLAFIDADKPSSASYFDWAVRLSRPGALVLVDNVVRGGRVADPMDTDPNVSGTRVLLDAVRDDRRVTATVLPSVGRKGYDGMLLARVEST